MAWSTYIVAIVFVGTCFLWSRYLNRKVNLPYPPGPPAEPIIGHARIIPSINQEVIFSEWSKIYGDVIYLHIPGRSYLVLNSRKSAIELLDKRSGIYSDRMKLVLFDMMGWDLLLIFMGYGKRFQKHRKLVHEYMHQKQCLAYEPFQTHQARRLLVNLLENPDSWRDHAQRFSTALIVKIVYGMDIISNDDPYLDISTKALESFVSCGYTGSTPVDFLPFLRYLPSWFPGTYYAFKARSLRTYVDELHDYPLELVKQQMKDGKVQPSYLSRQLEQLRGDNVDQEHLDDIRASTGTLFTGGAETTTSALLHFILEMVLFPEVQKKAQKEIDRVIGRNRLPELSDRGTLPYVDAVVNEVLRWNTVLPTGAPHRSIEDDVYEGMFIPKGTVVIYNAYAILRDEAVYSDPDSFYPERYLPKPEGRGEPSPLGQFGFGRRVCPGQYFAETSLWIAISSVLATFDIGRALDDNGKEIIPDVKLKTGLTSHPEPFPRTIKPRDHGSEDMIRQTRIWDEV